MHSGCSLPAWRYPDATRARGRSKILPRADSGPQWPNRQCLACEPRDPLRCQTSQGRLPFLRFAPCARRGSRRHSAMLAAASTVTAL